MINRVTLRISSPGSVFNKKVITCPSERIFDMKILPNGTVELHSREDVPRSRWLATVEEVADLLELAPRQARVRSLEFGVNFYVEGAAAFLKTLVAHGTRSLTPLGKHAFTGVQDECFDHVFKCYGVATNLLRAETHVERMRFLHRVAPSLTLHDLTSRRTLARLATIAEEQFSGLLALPPTMPNGLSLPQRKAWETGSNPRTWEKLPAVKARRRLSYLRRTLARHDADPMPAACAAHAAKWQELLNG